MHAGILVTLTGVALLALYVRYPSTRVALLLINDSRTRDDGSRQLYDYSPGPLKIDTVGDSSIFSTIYSAAIFRHVHIKHIVSSHELNSTYGHV